MDDALRFRRPPLRPADLLPRFLLPPAAALAGRAASDVEVERVTGLSRDGWRLLALQFPALGPDPGPPAARARRRLHFLVGRALGTPRHAPRLRGEPPEETPTLYVTAHIGDLRGLRYLLRTWLPIATVVAAADERRAAIAEEDSRYDARFPGEFPHALSSRRPHRLRSALRRGSLVATADLPDSDGVEAPFLGGRIRLDARPFRLARIAGVPCRALFLTAPDGRLTITVGERLPREDGAALEAFAGKLCAVSAASPFETDGLTLRYHARTP